MYRMELWIQIMALVCW